jgi:hypothetical protein
LEIYKAPNAVTMWEKLDQLLWVRIFWSRGKSIDFARLIGVDLSGSIASG